MDRELIRLILQNNFWEQNKSKILKEFFSDTTKGLYELIYELQERYHKDLTIGEIKAVYKTNNPTVTRAKWDLIEEVLDNLPVEISEDVAKECIQKAYITEMGRKIAQWGIDLVNGQKIDYAKIREIIEKTEQGEFSEDSLEAVSGELEDILEAISITTKWPFYLPPLATVASGTGPGLFTVIAARVETGKSAKVVSLAAAPGGFAEQGAVCNFYVNEEGAQRTQGRAVMCWTGMTLQELLLNPDIAKKKYAQIRNNIRFFECRGKTIDEIGKHISRSNPDISIIDMLDKLETHGTFAREDERLGSLYAKARSIGITTGTAMVATSQLSADAEGKTYISSANLASARTSKAAEADLLIGIGKLPQHDDNTRVLNIAKNKINGNHTDVICMIRPEISRYIA